MIITNVKFYSVAMKLLEPYTISYEHIDSTTNIFIIVETSTGVRGFGCAAPDKCVTNETPEGVMQQMENVVVPILKKSDPLNRIFLLSKIRECVPNSPSLLAGVDMALHDILGKVAGIPLYKILGGFRESIKTSITIGILSVAETVAKAREFIGKGFICLKIKGGANKEEDIERMIKVREAVGSDIELRFDANQGYSVKDALSFIEMTKSVNIELIEQPTPKKKLHLLGEITKNTEMLIMADESLMNLCDAFRLAKDNLVDTINVKLMKVGGIIEGTAISSVARATNLDIMVGCMDESSLGIMAGLHFALSRQKISYADLDGHLDLEGDPAGKVIIKNGIMYPNDLPGLGCELNL